MKTITQYFILLFFLSSLDAKNNNSPVLIDEVLTKHFQALGAIDLLQSKTTQIQGELSLMNLLIPFDAVQSENAFYYFKQHKVLNGMDLTPPLFRKMNKQGAFFVVDEGDYGRGMNVTKLPEEAKHNWQFIKTTELSPLYYFKKLGCEFAWFGAQNSNNQKKYQILVSIDGADEVKVFLDKESHLITAMVFRSYHPQLGWVDIKRTYDAYELFQGLMLPRKWTDHRAGTDIVYRVNSIEFNNALDHELFAVSAVNSGIALSHKDIQKIIETYLVALDKQSPFSSSVEKIRIGLLKNLAQGNYGKINNPQLLSQQLTDEIINLTGDPHFGIDHNPELFNLLQGDKAYDSPVTLSDQQRSLETIQADTGLDKGFYYLKITEMLPMEITADLIDSHMATAAEKKGLIIDLRDNTGGAASFNQYLASYLFPENTVLYERVFKDKTESVRTLQTKHDLATLKTMPVYVFVNKNTVSAGEQLAYLLQNHRRATIIGETTFGAAHGSIDVPLFKGLIGLVPVAYEKHVLTKRDWEGSGVTPDITAATQDLTLLLQQIGDEQ